MARGTTLLELRRMLRAEIGQASTQTNVGADYIATLNQKLQRTQQMLYDDYDWPFLRVKCPVFLEQGQRYYDMPYDPNDTQGVDIGFGPNSISQLEMERIEHVTINYSGRPTPLERGISWEQYAQYNSDNDERASPCRRWDIKRSTTDVEQIEVWPIPDDDSQIMEFTGIKTLRPLISDSDVADMDDILIVLTTAIPILAKAKSGDLADMKEAAAARRLQLRGRVKAKTRTVNLARGNSYDQTNRGKTIIRIGSQTN